MAYIRMENIVKKFGKVMAVDNVTFEINNGEFFTLVGPSGCGKTTLLRIIAGLEPVNSGHILFNDKLFNHVSPRNRNIAMVFQQYALYPNMNVRDNLGFSLKLKKVPKKERDDRIVEVATLLGIGGLLERKPKELSGGQQQRVALGRAIIREPVAFLFDEPLSNLDAKLRISMRQELHNLHNNLGTTFVYVTHDQLEAMTMSDRIALMNNGRVQQIGTPRELYGRPRNKFVAGFLGTPSMNFIEHCELLDEGGILILKAPFSSFKVPEAKAGAIRKNTRGKTFIFGIRPENILMVTGEIKSDQTMIKAQVSIVESIGSSLIVYVHIGGQLIQAVVSNEIEPKPGEYIYLKFQLDHMHLFDEETEESLFNN